jgi:polysaccharide export outer membrane protein
MQLRIALLLLLCLWLVACASPRPAAEGLLPAPSAVSDEDYRIGPGDLLRVDVFQVPELSRQVRVNSRGEVSLPLIGTVRAAGLTGQELEALLAQRLSERYLVDPQVYVFIEEFISQRVTVEGLVKRQGVYPLKGPTTLLQVIAISEGTDEVADTERVQLFRANGDGKKEIYFFNIDAIRSGQAQDPLIKADDIIVVHKDGGKAFIKGLGDTMRSFFHFGVGATIPLF